MKTIQASIDYAQNSLPTWAVALLVLLVGWCLALVVRLVVAKILAVLRFNHLCDRAEISEFLRKGQVGYTPSQLVGACTYWVILFLTLLEAADLLNLGATEAFARQIAASLPNALGALLIIFLGLAVASFLGKFVVTLARNAGVAYANLLGRVTKWTGVVFILAIAVEQLQVGKTIISSTFQILFAAIAFGSALAFGLGCKDMARIAMEKFVANLRERHRDGSGPDLEG